MFEGVSAGGTGIYFTRILPKMSGEGDQMTDKMSKRMAETMLDQRLEAVRALHRRMDAVERWARVMLSLHRPYVTGRMDLSILPLKDLTQAVLEEAADNLFCSECQTRWPCRQIPRLRLLLKATQSGRRDQGESLADIHEMLGQTIPQNRGSGIETIL